MKTLHLAIIFGSASASVIVTLVLIEVFFQNYYPYPGLEGIQTETIPQNSTVHACSLKLLQNYDPGPMGGFMCPIIGFHTFTKVAGNSGFDEVCLDKRYSAGNFVLGAGHNGSISYMIYSNLPLSEAIKLPHINMTNRASFSHYRSIPGGYSETYTESLKGVTVSFEPKFEILWPWSSILVTATISSTRNAETGSHWLFLPPGVCNEGPGLVLTVENSSRTG
ncbi:MAG: hypothetical protein KGI33_11670 [Thaumarchaeota archaeon]|nr:hypothetical protein [Nitrososphaerota archaeon]